MSVRRAMSLSLLVFVSSLPLIAELPERSELTKSPRYVDSTALTFDTRPAVALLDDIKVISSRNGALFGFNTPEVQLRLPKTQNSHFVQIEFGEAKLLDKKGKPVKYELERGVYMNESWSDEIRFTNPKGPKSLEFEKAVGKVLVKYPTISTISFKKGKAQKGGYDVKFDGPYVTYNANVETPKEAGFQMKSYQPIRAYDAKGRQLERAEGEEMEFEGDTPRKTIAFWGNVAELRLDVVTEWSPIEISYELPPTAKLPDSQAGMGVTPLGETTGGKVTKNLLVENATAPDPEPQEVAADADVMTRLQAAGYREATPEWYVMSAIRDSVETVQIFLEAGVPIDAKNDQGATALLHATSYQNWEVAKMLLEKGADPNIGDSNNSTPLLQASQHCEATALVKLLLKKGANPNAKAKGGGTPLMLAEAMNCSDTITLLKKAGAKK